MKEFYPEGMLLKSQENAKWLLSADSVSSAAADGVILEAMAVLCDRSHDITVDLGCMKGIIAREEGAIGIAEGKTRDIALISRVGKPVCFKVIDVQYDSFGIPFARLSRRAAQEDCLDYILSTAECGDIIAAKVTHLETFGAFLDIGCGNIALLPIDSISVSRISHPSDRLSVGDNLKVIIKDIAPDGRITLSLKELLGTWEENAQSFLQGQTVSGIVRSVEEYGIFVELAPNLAGLAEPSPDIRVGQGVCVYIKSVIPEKMKIKLIIIDKLDCRPTEKIKYYYEGNHIDKFCYSPDDCRKQICISF
ncbi:MAG: 30S ribosomal protein S1 [Clostridia bacterium]|nr:30S ribosomal protein S1 [Clostridia bacterium]